MWTSQISTVSMYTCRSTVSFGIVWTRLRTRSYPSLYTLIRLPRRPLALGRGRNLFQGFIPFPPTLPLYEVAHSVPLGSVGNGYPFIEDVHLRYIYKVENHYLQKIISIYIMQVIKINYSNGIIWRQFWEEELKETSIRIHSITAKQILKFANDTWDLKRVKSNVRP